MADCGCSGLKGISSAAELAEFETTLGRMSNSELESVYVILKREGDRDRMAAVLVEAKGRGLTFTDDSIGGFGVLLIVGGIFGLLYALQQQRR